MKLIELTLCIPDEGDEYYDILLSPEERDAKYPDTHCPNGTPLHPYDGEMACQHPYCDCNDEEID